MQVKSFSLNHEFRIFWMIVIIDTPEPLSREFYRNFFKTCISMFSTDRSMFTHLDIANWKTKIQPLGLQSYNCNIEVHRFHFTVIFNVIKKPVHLDVILPFMTSSACYQGLGDFCVDPTKFFVRELTDSVSAGKKLMNSGTRLTFFVTIGHLHFRLGLAWLAKKKIQLKGYTKCVIQSKTMLWSK